MTALLRWKKILIGQFILLILLSASCAVYKPITSIKPTESLPDSFSEGPALPPIDCWWEQFENSELEQFIDEALSGNLTLKMAWSRLDQARQLAKIAGAGSYPGLDSGFSTQQSDFRGSLPPGSVKRIRDFSVTMTLSYQVDLWKKIKNSRLSAVLDFEAGREDLEATALAITSGVAELWASLAEQDAYLQLLEEQLEVAESYLELVEARFGRGLSSAVDVYQQRLHVENIKEQFPVTRMQQKLLKNQLALLLGKQPTADIYLAGSELPMIKGLPPMGIPAEILRDRPDVRAAELRLFAADHRVATAVADRFPSISFSVTGGSQAGTVSNLFEQWFTNLAGNIMAPLFDAGRRKAEVKRNQAVVRERFYQWEAVLLNAFSEVEDALAGEEGLSETYSSTIKQVELARRTLDRSRALYVNGLTDYLTVLTSLQSLQNLQRVEINTRKSLLSNRIKLHSALGGSWTGTLIEPQNNLNTSD
ncbi:efflux transporter outer membrane subunit [Thermodesulfobacteriota bacterium]